MYLPQFFFLDYSTIGGGRKYKKGGREVVLKIRSRNLFFREFLIRIKGKKHLNNSKNRLVFARKFVC